jgi:hypothetical protein
VSLSEPGGKEIMRQLAGPAAEPETATKEKADRQHQVEAPDLPEPGYVPPRIIYGNDHAVTMRERPSVDLAHPLLRFSEL